MEKKYNIGFEEHCQTNNETAKFVYLTGSQVTQKDNVR